MISKVPQHVYVCATFCLCVVCHLCVVCRQVSDASGSMRVTVVKDENPFLRSDLLSEECFILDRGHNRLIFVWKGLAAVTPAGGFVLSRLCGVTCFRSVRSGRNANPGERNEAMKTAEGFIQQMGYPANTQVPFVPPPCCFLLLPLIIDHIFPMKEVESIIFGRINTF